MTVPAELVRDVRAAEQRHPATEPLLTVSARIAQQLNQPPGTVLEILQDRHTVKEQAA